MQNKIIRYLIITLIISSCNNNNPDWVVRRYLDAVKNNDNQKAYNCMAPDDRRAYSQEEYSNSETITPLTKQISLSMQYKIISLTKTAPDRAIVKVNISMIDPNLLFSIYGDQIENMAENELRKFFKANKIGLRKTIKQRDVEYRLVYVSGTWYIFANMAKKKYASDLYNSALTLYDKGLLDEALDTFRDVRGFNHNIEKTYQYEESILKKQIYINEYLKTKITHNIEDTNLFINYNITNIGTYMIKGFTTRIKFIDSSMSLRDKVESVENRLIGFEETLRGNIISDLYHDDFKELVSITISDIKY